MIKQFKCPMCGAAFQINPDQAQIRCEYCGNISIHNSGPKPPPPQAPVVQPPPQMMTPPSPAQAPLVFPTAAPPPVIPKKSRALLFLMISMVLPTLIGGIAMIAAFSAGSLADSATRGVGLPSILGPSYRWRGTKSVMLADVNGDGQVEALGWIDEGGAGSNDVRIAAFSASTGERVWTTPMISSGSGGYTRAAVSGDKLLVADEAGMLRGYALHNGQALWQAPLGERSNRFCGTEPGFAAVVLNDRRIIKVALATGQVMPAGQATPSRGTSGCLPIWTDESGSDPRFRVTTGIDARRMRDIEGLSVSFVLQGAEIPYIVFLGSRSPGTSVPTAMATNAQTGQEVWRSAIPTADQLNAQRFGLGDVQATISQGRLIVAYENGPSVANTTWRVACLDVNTGRNLWETALSQDSPYGGIAASNQYVFLSLWGSLIVLDLGTGQQLRSL